MSFAKHPSFRSRRALVALVAAAALGLSACGGDETTEPEDTVDASASPSPTASATQSETPEPTIEPSSDLDAIEVTDGDVPEVVIPAPWAIDETRTLVLSEGDEQVLGDESIATLNYAGYNARTGEVFDSSWERGAPATFPLQSVVPGFQKGLSGQSVGSRVLIAMPSEDGYAQGNPGAGIEVGDTIVFIVDILSANFDEATGEPVAPAEGLPTVTLSSDGVPEITTPEGEAPTELVVAPLITGPGPEVTENATIQVKHRSWVWGTGEVLESDWRAQQGPLNTLIEGWKQGLVGQTVGSRVMLVVPPELAYPDGIPSMDLEAGQTLVYVVDILHASEG